jgi:hypothetical protein
MTQRRFDPERRFGPGAVVAGRDESLAHVPAAAVTSSVRARRTRCAVGVVEVLARGSDIAARSRHERATIALRRERHTVT